MNDLPFVIIVDPSNRKTNSWETAMSSRIRAKLVLSNNNRAFTAECRQPLSNLA